VNKTAIITGASRGIGRATAELMALNGYNVVIQYLNSEKEAYSLLEKLEKQNCAGMLYKADITERKQVEAMVEKCLSSFGQIDVLVNNAGIAQTKLFPDILENEWDLMMDVHVKGMFHCCQSVLHYMLKKKKGKIINISSIWGIVGASCEVHYSTAKAAVIGFTKALAKELGPSNIQVNCVAPGVVETHMTANLSEDDKAALIMNTPLSRMGTPQDIAQAILFLASDEADFITGQVLSPNGGYVI
jgi:3-oxoacyl-[acyl-carrier protein] reductase